MTGPRLAIIVLVILTVTASMLAVDKRVDRALGRQQSASEIQVTMASRMNTSKAAHVRTSPPGLVVRLLQLPLQWVINRSIAVTRERILASLAQEPDDYDTRDRMWQRLHRLQTWRNRLA